MSSENQSNVTKALYWAYEKALDGLPGQPTAKELADEYLKQSDSKAEAIDSLIRWQIAKCSASGFITGLGGAITLPLAIPTDLAITYLINIRMVAAIAHIQGHDLHADQTRTTVFLALVGDSAGEVLSKAGAKIGTKVAGAMLSKIPGHMLTKINQAIGFRLATKAGEKGIINIAKFAPGFGGIVGGAVNGVTCNTIGNSAKKILATKKPNKRSGNP